MEKNKNLRIEPDPEDKTEQEDEDKEDILWMPTIDPEKLVGHSFIPLPDEDGNQFRIKIVELLTDYKKNLASDPRLIRFRAKVEQTGMEEIIAYNDIMNMMEDGENTEQYHKFHALSSITKVHSHNRIPSTMVQHGTSKYSGKQVM